ncbi:TPA: hypothetical protein DCG86_09155 [Candidatus Marinimicrobia bacterium]|nr:hypothetical protein [Candidatus Neomarinimicrobiota bacterium]
MEFIDLSEKKIWSCIASFSLKEELREKFEKFVHVFPVVLVCNYTDYSGSYLDHVIIDYFKARYPDNIVSEFTNWNGENGIIFGSKEFMDELRESMEDYPLGFRDLEDFYSELQMEDEAEFWEFFISEIPCYYEFDRETVLDWLNENRSGYYGQNPDGSLDVYSDLLIEEMVEAGVLKPVEDE